MSLCLCLAGLSALCLSTGRHHAAALGAPPSPRRRRALRGLGWLGLALSLALAVAAEGAVLGAVSWFGGLTAAGLGLVVLLAYRPRLVAWAGPAALALALLSLAAAPG